MVAAEVAHQRLEVAAVALALPLLLAAGVLLLGCWPTHQLAAAAGAALLLPSPSPHRQVGVVVQVLTSPSLLLRHPRAAQAAAGVVAAAAVAVVLVARLRLLAPFESCTKRQCRDGIAGVETRTKWFKTVSGGGTWCTGCVFGEQSLCRALPGATYCSSRRCCSRCCLRCSLRARSSRVRSISAARASARRCRQQYNKGNGAGGPAATGVSMRIDKHACWPQVCCPPETQLWLCDIA